MMGFIIFGIPALILIVLAIMSEIREIRESKTISIMEVFWSKKFNVELKEEVKQVSSIPKFYFDSNTEAREVNPKNLFYFRYGKTSNNYVVISMSRNSINADINDHVLVMYNRNLYIRKVVYRYNKKVEVISPFDDGIKEVINCSDMIFCIKYIFVGGKRLL